MGRSNRRSNYVIQWRMSIVTTSCLAELSSRPVKGAVLDIRSGGQFLLREVCSCIRDLRNVSERTRIEQGDNVLTDCSVDLYAWSRSCADTRLKEGAL